jgi:hypothetical protein
MIPRISLVAEAALVFAARGYLRLKLGSGRSLTRAAP